MQCPNCEQEYPLDLPFSKAIENGNAYEQICPNCHRVVGIRPRIDTDPPAADETFSDIEVERMKFTQSRLRRDCEDQTKSLENTGINRHV